MVAETDKQNTMLHFDLLCVLLLPRLYYLQQNTSNSHMTVVTHCRVDTPLTSLTGAPTIALHTAALEFVHFIITSSSILTGTTCTFVCVYKNKFSYFKTTSSSGNFSILISGTDTYR